MRGLAMLLVVVGHVIFFSFDDHENLIYRILCDGLQIPLFFMVSGFLFKVPTEGVWTMLRQKAFLLCVPATIFMVAWVWVNHGSLFVACFDSVKQGYWFTFQLFEFIVLYTLIRLMLKFLKLGYNITHLLMVSVTVVILFAGVWFKREEHIWAWISLMGLVHLTSFPYFVLGTILAERGLIDKNLSVGQIKWGG